MIYSLLSLNSQKVIIVFSISLLLDCKFMILSFIFTVKCLLHIHFHSLTFVIVIDQSKIMHEFPHLKILIIISSCLFSMQK